ncbi:MAG: PRC-barrel domain-containing protein [Kiritimatiellia bacterium]
MLRSLTELTGYRVAGTDEDLGKVKDFLFDDKKWTVRHMVLDTGKWLPGRQALIAPEALGEADWEEHLLLTKLTKNKIENSPSIEEDKPVSRQQEIELFRYYAWMPYWGAGATAPYPEPPAVTVPGEEKEGGDPHLRSVKQVKGYHVSAADGDAGHIDDFIAEDDTWVIRYIAVDTRKFLPGKKVLLAPWWFKQFNWAEHKTDVGMKQEDIRNAPSYDPSAPVNRKYEERLYDFHGRPKYWEE